MIRNLFIAAAAATSLAACATTSTPYQPADKSGYGFSEQRIEETKYRITFRGNSSTSRETVENGLLYRAAELTVQNGYDYFVVIESDTEESKRYSTTGDPAFFGHYYYGYPRRYYAFPYYAYGWGWGPDPFYDSYTREITRYSAVAFISLGKGAKPADNPQAFDAREVMSNLRDLVMPPAPTGS
jgi:hypothetical protein